MQAANKTGGVALFLENPTEEALRFALSSIEYDGDVLFKNGQPLRHIHKIVNGKNVWFFANPELSAAHAEAALKGTFKIGVWDPHTGEMQAGYPVAHEAGRSIVSLSLPPNHSLFLVEE
jgi:hypothetical protein